MALQDMVRQMQPNNKHASVPTGPINSAQSTGEKIPAPVTSKPVVQPRRFVREQTAATTAEKLVMPKDAAEAIEQNANATRTLGPVEAETLMSLAAVQIKYGRAAEAVPYLLVLRKYQPKNLDALRLLSLAFLKLERWVESEHILDEMEKLQAQQTSENGGLFFLYRSLVNLKLRGAQDARSWFDKFREFARNMKTAGAK